MPRVKVRPPADFIDPRFWEGLIKRGSARVGWLDTPIGPLNIDARFGMGRAWHPDITEPPSPLSKYGVFGGIRFKKTW